MHCSGKSANMRILQLGPYPPPHGGVQSNLVAIHRLLRDKGISSRIVNITRYRQRSDGEVYYPRNWLELLALLLILRYDIVHIHIGGTVTMRLLGLSLLCCLLPGRKAVLTFHSGGYPASKEGRDARPRTLRGFVFRRFDRIIGVNPDIVRLFGAFGVRSDRVRLIYPHALPSELPDRPLPQSLDDFFATHRPVLISVGLLEPEYDLPRQIEVLGLIRARHPQAGLVLIGSGSLEATLRAAIGRTTYAPHVLLCGDVPHDDTLLAIAASDLCLRTTVYDGDSIFVREALHLGVPIIATDTGMRPDGVLLVPFSDTQALGLAIERILARPPTPHVPRGQNEDNVRMTLAIYEELMAESSR
jgi:glycosyltransferase involved in cell wall biosynthesis